MDSPAAMLCLVMCFFAAIDEVIYFVYTHTGLVTWMNTFVEGFFK